MFKTVLALILFVLAGGLFFVYASPTYSAAQMTLDERGKYVEANTKVREVQELRNAITAKYQQLSPANISKLQALLPDHVDNVKLVLDIDGVAARRGIQIGTVVARREDQKANETANKGTVASATPSLGIAGAVQDAQKYKSLILEFNVTASYNDFVLFMRDLEQSLRIVDLVSLKMEPGTSRESSVPVELRGLAGAGQNRTSTSDQYNFAVQIKTYWLP